MKLQYFFCVCALLGLTYWQPARADDSVWGVSFFLQRLQTVNHLAKLEKSHTAMENTWDRCEGSNDGEDYKRIERLKQQGSATQRGKVLTLTRRRRDRASGELLPPERLDINPCKVGIVVVDMWQGHSDWNAHHGVAKLIPRMNQALDVAREMGSQVIFAPSWGVDPLAGRREHKEVAEYPHRPLPKKITLDPPDPPHVKKPSCGYPGMEPTGMRVPHTALARPCSQHTDLVVKARDLIIDDRNPVYEESETFDHRLGQGGRVPQELFNILKARGITHLLYTGSATNVCVCWYRSFSMTEMTRYGFDCTIIRDLTDAVTKNTRSYTPDTGVRDSVAYLERYIGTSIDSSQLLASHRPSRYTNTVMSEPGLLVYFRMDAKPGYCVLQDLLVNQSAWIDKHGGVVAEVPGAIVGDSDTAIGFQGKSAFLIGPSWWDQLNPASHPLVSLSKDSFSVEAWVQIDGGLGENQWVLSHDNDKDDNIDFLLGLGADNKFCFRTRSDGGGCANEAVGSTTVTRTDMDKNRWFHIVGVQDIAGKKVSLYVNGIKEREVELVGQAVGTRSTLQIGSRGATAIDPGGSDEKSDAFISDYGYELFTGVIDDVAIYKAALSSDRIADHYRAGLGQ